jgi:hypothetical protein
MDIETKLEIEIEIVYLICVWNILI